MTTIQKADYVFSVDTEKTKKYDPFWVDRDLAVTDKINTVVVRGLNKKYMHW